MALLLFNMNLVYDGEWVAQGSLEFSPCMHVIMKNNFAVWSNMQGQVLIMYDSGYLSCESYLALFMLL